MTLDFDLLFSVNRTSDTYQLVFTDQTVYDVAGVVKGFYKIEYPDGLIVENTDTDNPDFTDLVEETTLSLRLKKFKLITGTYTITQKIYIDAVLYSLQKTITLSFVEPSLTLTNNFNLVTPSVSFLDETNYVVASYTNTKTRIISCEFPASTGIIGTPQTLDSELFMVDAGNYYEGLYTPKLSTDSVYVGTNHSVSWINEKDYSFDIRRIIGHNDLIEVINNFKANVKTPKDDQDYQMIVSLYSHILGKVKKGETDIEELVKELLELATGDCGCGTYTYTAIPLDPYSTDAAANFPYIDQVIYREWSALIPFNSTSTVFYRNDAGKIQWFKSKQDANEGNPIYIAGVLNDAWWEPITLASTPTSQCIVQTSFTYNGGAKVFNLPYTPEGIHQLFVDGVLQKGNYTLSIFAVTYTGALSIGQEVEIFSTGCDFTFNDISTTDIIRIADFTYSGSSVFTLPEASDYIFMVFKNGKKLDPEDFDHTLGSDQITILEVLDLDIEADRITVFYAINKSLYIASFDPLKDVSGGFSANDTATLNLDTVSELSTIPRRSRTRAFVNDLERGGLFTYVALGLASDGGVVFDSLDGGFWVRQYSGSILSKWFGTVGDGIVDDYSAIASSLSYINSIGGGSLEIQGQINLNGNTVTFPSGVTLTQKEGLFKNGTLAGNDTILDLKNTQFFETDINFSGSFNSVNPINVKVFGGTHNGVANDIDNIIKAKELSYFIASPIFVFPKNTVLNNPVAHDGTLGTALLQIPYVIDWAENTTLSPIGARSEIKFSNNTAPLFFINYADKFKCSAFDFVFTGLVNTSFVTGASVQFLTYYGIGNFSVFQNSQLCSVIVYMNTNGFIFEDLTFSHETGATEDESYHFGIYGAGKRVSTGVGADDYIIDLVTGTIRNIKFSDYQFGTFCTSQKFTFKTIRGTKRRQINDIPGHLLYMSGNAKTVNNSECFVHDLYEDDTFDVSLDTTYYLGTLAIKQTQNSVFSKVMSFDPAGLLQSVDGCDNNVFEDFTWKASAGFKPITPLLNLPNTDGSRNNIFRNFSFDCLDYCLKIIEWSSAAEADIYGNVFENFYIKGGIYNFAELVPPYVTPLTINAINDRGSNKYLNFTFETTNDLIALATQGTLYITISADATANGYFEANVINLVTALPPKISGTVRHKITQPIQKGYATTSGLASPVGTGSNFNLGSIYTQLDYTTNSELVDIWIKEGRAGNSFSWKRFLTTSDFETGFVSPSVAGITSYRYSRVMNQVTISGVAAIVGATLSFSLPFKPLGTGIFSVGEIGEDVYLKITNNGANGVISAPVPASYEFYITYSTNEIT